MDFDHLELFELVLALLGLTASLAGAGMVVYTSGPMTRWLVAGLMVGAVGIGVAVLWLWSHRRGS